VGPSHEEDHDDPGKAGKYGEGGPKKLEGAGEKLPGAGYGDPHPDGCGENGIGDENEDDPGNGNGADAGVGNPDGNPGAIDEDCPANGTSHGVWTDACGGSVTVNGGGCGCDGGADCVSWIGCKSVAWSVPGVEGGVTGNVGCRIWPAPPEAGGCVARTIVQPGAGEAGGVWLAVVEWDSVPESRCSPPASARNNRELTK
jgi:hypothetical protein